MLLLTIYLEADDPAPPGQAGRFRPEPASPSPITSPITFNIAATGDILIHSGVYEQAALYATEGGPAYDFDPMFKRVRPLLEAADLAICHLEVPLSPDNSDLSSYPLFNAPGDLAGAIAKAGYDTCSTASNHSLDQGVPGAKATIRVLERAGLEHHGTARTPADAAAPATFEIDGATVAHLSYTYGLNTGPVATDAGTPWIVNVINARRILADARRARLDDADFVIVSLHWGLEYQQTPTEQQRSLARKLLKTDAVDLIVGHHAHVVQPIQRINEKFVVYGTGNFLSHQGPGVTATCCPPETQDGVIVHVEVSNEPGHFVVTGLSFTPTWVEPGTHRILPVAQMLRKGDVDELRAAALRASYDRTVEAINLLNAERAGVEPAAPLP